MEIRLATLNDVPDLVKMGASFHASSPYATLTGLDLNAIEATAVMLVNRPDADVLVATTSVSSEHTLDPRTVGMLGLFLHHHPISGARVASELFWWVEPEYRGLTGLKLLHRAERWATERGAQVLQMIAPSPEVERLYDRSGFTRVEVSYQKRLV